MCNYDGDPPTGGDRPDYHDIDYATIGLDLRACGGYLARSDAQLVSDVINQWKCGAITIIYHASWRMSAEDFRYKILPIEEAATHDALIAGYQVFLVNTMGDWPAYPELEEPKEPVGYWWMRILYERSTLRVSILTPVYRRHYGL